MRRRLNELMRRVCSLISRCGGPTNVIFIGGIISLCGAVWASRIDPPTIVIFIGGIISACGAVWASGEQNQDAKRLEKKNDEIIALNEIVNSTLTGGDSFCYLSPVENVVNAFF